MATMPLSAITAEEIEKAVAIFRAAHNDKNAAFSSSGLLEPPKAKVKRGEACDRIVRFLGTDSEPDGGFQADINVTKGEVENIRRLGAEAQAPYGFLDVGTAIALTKTNETWLSAMRARGIAVETEEDLKLIQIDPWPAGGFVHSSIPKGHRAMRCISFVKQDRTDNGYARPVHGLIAHVDLTDGKVTEVEDTGAVPLPPNSGRFDKDHQTSTRTDLQELEITQPDGPSFSVDGYKVKWQGYEFSVSMHPVNGLVLHQMSLHRRPLLYRAALSEMVVPYGDKDGMHSWKHVLDASEYNMGMLVNSLKLGCDCLGEIHYFDTHQVTWEGEVRTIENSICMHEEDYGIQWKHYDSETEQSEVRRSRRLVVSSIFTIGNYDYGIFWYLYLDGTIQLEVKLTGIVGVSAVTPKTHNPAQSPLIGEGLASPVHQHAFCFRLDWELDGGTNSLFENNIELIPMDDKELGAAGDHTVMHVGQGGLPELTSGDRDISECDLVMWHTVAVTHVPRPEDWPVMPVEYSGFHLIPVGFFDKNPTLDLPSKCH